MKNRVAGEQPIVRVVFHDKQLAREEFVVFADPQQIGAWRKDHGAVPLVDVVQSFDVFVATNKGVEGVLDRPSRGQLEDVFGTSNQEKIVARILEDGSVKGNFHGEHTSRDRAGSFGVEEFRLP